VSLFEEICFLCCIILFHKEAPNDAQLAKVLQYLHSKIQTPEELETKVFKAGEIQDDIFEMNEVKNFYLRCPTLFRVN